MSTPALVTIGTPVMPGGVELGATVLYIGCGHEVPCPEAGRPCSVALYGPMELMQQQGKGGRLVARPDDVEDPRDWPVFDPHELSTPEAVARYAARTLDEEAAA